MGAKFLVTKHLGLCVKWPREFMWVVENICDQCWRRFLGIIRRHASVSKTNQLQTAIVWFSFIKLRINLQIPLCGSVYLPEVVIFNRLFLKLNCFHL